MALFAKLPHLKRSLSASMFLSMLFKGFIFMHLHVVVISLTPAHPVSSILSVTLHTKRSLFCRVFMEAYVQSCFISDFFTLWCSSLSQG